MPIAEIPRDQKMNSRRVADRSSYCRHALDAPPRVCCLFLDDIGFEPQEADGGVVVTSQVVDVRSQGLAPPVGIGRASHVVLEGQHLALVRDGLHIILIPVR